MSYEVNRRLAAAREPLRNAAEIDSVTAGIIRGSGRKWRLSDLSAWSSFEVALPSLTLDTPCR